MHKVNRWRIQGTSALKNRIGLNNNSRYNLEDWIIEQADIKSGMSILDIGCGTGKQIKAIQKRFNSRIIGIDISLDGLDFSNDSTTLICGDFDQNIISGKFDRILSTYAIYYSKDMLGTINKYQKMLNPNGMLFLAGPADGTNMEVYSIVNSLIDQLGIKVEHRSTTDFLSAAEIEGERVKLNNHVHFDSPKHVMEWWSNHNSYIEELHEQVENKLPEKLSLTKNVLGIKIR
jgi:SAM-dependent methyltransferase